MNIGDIVNNQLKVSRQEAMKTSPQLMLGELILKMEAVRNKELPVVFNTQFHPIKLSSWRGSYDELALEYSDVGIPLPVYCLLILLKECIGKTFTGYKGGDFLMGKNTPVWVANYGETHGFETDSEYNEQAVVHIQETGNEVIIHTKLYEY